MCLAAPAIYDVARTRVPRTTRCNGNRTNFDRLT